MSLRTAWIIRIAAVAAGGVVCYLALVAIDSRSPWVIVPLVAVGVVGGEVIGRLTRPSTAVEERRDPDSGV